MSRMHTECCPVTAVRGRSSRIVPCSPKVLGHSRNFQTPLTELITPYLIPNCRSHVEAIEELVAAGASANAAGKHAKTPLLAAAALGHAPAVAALLRCGASPAAADSSGLTALHYIALCWPQPQPRPGSKAEGKAAAGGGAGSAAAAAGGAEPGSPLAAATANYVTAAQQLLAAGANPLAPDHNGETPKALAARLGIAQLQVGDGWVGGWVGAWVDRQEGGWVHG